MPDYRRAFVPGGTFFFTLVTERREPFLITPLARELLHGAIADCMRLRPFTMDAIVLLPDHLHAIWTLPPGDTDFSSRWARIKAVFTRSWLDAGGSEAAVSDSRTRNRRRGVWQRRFWEHILRDETDLERHVDYVHFNPVKHGLAACPHAWGWSSFARHVRGGIYSPGWGCACEGAVVKPHDFSWAAGLEME